MNTSSKVYPEHVDLTNCDKEPIHILGKTQEYGVLLVCDLKTLCVKHCSENAPKVFGIAIENLLKLELLEIFNKEIVQTVIDECKADRKLPIQHKINGQEYLLIPHALDSKLYIDIEPFAEEKNNLVRQQELSHIIGTLSSVNSIPEMFQETASLIKSSLNYDRVMVYQFDKNWNGAIVAEAREDHLESWLGLNYPATDIPSQARALFLKQGVRIIEDVSSKPQNLIPEFTEEGNPVDLSRCELRAVSPIHIEYLTNMKVGATLNAAIVSEGVLWGLIACHHYSPKYVNYYDRLSVKFLTQVFSTQLTLRRSNTLLKKTSDTSELRHKLIQYMSKQWDVLEGLTSHSVTMRDVTEASGASVLIDGEMSQCGHCPDPETVKALIHWISEHTETSKYFTNELSKSYPLGNDIAEIASGVLCIFISKKPLDALIWFKPEIIQTVAWAGNPDKSFEDDGLRLSPRKSFEKWEQAQRGISEPWEDYEIASAEALKENISEIILRQYDEVKKLNEQLKEAYKNLESFSYSVSHDLRAPLRGIDGFAQIIKEDYFDALDDFGKSAVQTIIKSSNTMNNLIDDILAFSGLGSGGKKLESLSVNKLVGKVLNFIQVDTVYPEAKVVVQKEMPRLVGDKSMTFQLLNNLIGNALKYSTKSDQPTIEVGATSVGDKETHYWVRDNGIGFDQKQSERIFEVFNRLVSDEYQGSGIGLAIAKKVVDKHEGHIWVESEVGSGTTFYFKYGT